VLRLCIEYLTVQDLCMKLPAFLVKKVRVKLDLMQNAVKYYTKLNE